MYEVGKWVGHGYYADFFRIRNDPTLGVKIDIRGKKALKEEYGKSLILEELGVPVPHCRGVKSVLFPSYFNQTIEKQNPPELSLRQKNKLKDLAGEIYSGLIMEIIEQDIKLVSGKRITYYFEKEVKRVKALGIIPGRDADMNVLWSQKNAKIYFIDFERWIIPKELYPGPFKKLRRWLFGK
ncbi:hypothetical protein COV12_02145 [Candidatus Woesearchaeota archaeon CG10_big_fil_rev_8_21_14_0_10_32_24]|nr:MAG: hypothetical protein COV12_02145 [Candidatus Woesearchaeota archaeon CG10_big_fil_rev_8_21_14_0_10_32_24]